MAFTGTLLSMSRREAAQAVVDSAGQFDPNPGRAPTTWVFGYQDFTRFVDGES